MHAGRRRSLVVFLAAVISLSLVSTGGAAKKKKPKFNPTGVYTTRAQFNGVNFSVANGNVEKLSTLVVANCPAGQETDGRPVEITQPIPLTKKVKKTKKGKKVSFSASYSGGATSDPNFTGSPDSNVTLAMTIRPKGDPPGTATGTMTVTPKDPFTNTLDCAPITFAFTSSKAPPRGTRG